MLRRRARTGRYGQQEVSTSTKASGLDGADLGEPREGDLRAFPSDVELKPSSSP